MQRFRWIALQGSSRGFLTPLLLIYFITTSGIPAHAADDPTACRTPVARVVSIQGSIEVLRAPQNDWIKVTRLDTALCEGDRLRTGVLSRAALFIQTETLVRVDQNTSISVSQTAEETLVEFRQEEVLPAAASAYTCGAGYFITRFPRKFRVRTPHLNAAVEGTEFLVAMRCESTELSVFEGKVLAAGTADNIFPAQSISSGQVLTIGGSEPPTVKLLVKPTDAVQWVLYYPPLSDAIAEADLPPAEQCRSLSKPLDQTCLTQRAEVLLRLGRVEEAQREVDEAGALDSGSGDANALRAIISIARNDKAGAIEAATAATTASPNSSRAWLALSYAQQASFKLEDSLMSARKAQALEPNSSVTNARVAELLMSLGRIKEAEVAARAAVDANPAESRAHTVLGFVHLAQIKTKAARADFEAAIERDSSDPMPRLGLGLGIIRDGKLADGREQLEIAVALDPSNSLLRSYVGKAYYEENTKERDQLAAAQFELAKQLDPNDPTPWLYNAILKQTENNPSESLTDLQESIELNDNRAVYRSRLALDQDLAARNVRRAQIYEELRFEALADLESSVSLLQAPSNSTAHRLLADAFANRPRHEIASVSELLQSQLYQLDGPIPPHTLLAESDLVSLNREGPSDPTSGEFNSLFIRDGLYALFNGMAGSNETWADEASIGLQRGALAGGLSQYRAETSGFRPNNDYSDKIYGGLIAFRPSYATGLQVEVKSRRLNHGDISFRFDPYNFFPGDRRSVESDLFRVGLRQELAPGSNVVFSYIARDRTETQHNELAAGPGLPPVGRFDIDSEHEASLGEAQYVGQFERLNLIIGLATVEDDVNDITTFEIFGFPPPVIAESSSVIRQTTAYIYGHIFPAGPLSVTAGLSADDYTSPETNRHQVNPKLGLLWSPTASTTLRLAAFRTLKRVLVADQTIEPTQVVGFNQFFDDVNGTDSTRYAFGIDQRFPNRVFTGLELSYRDLSVPEGSPAVDTKRTEDQHRLYAYWVPSSQWSCGANFEFERYSREVLPLDPAVPKDLSTYHAQLFTDWHASGRTTFSLKISGIKQRIEYPSPSGIVLREDEFALLDASVRYKLPGRRGLLSFTVNNVLDTRFSYQDLNFQTSEPRLPPFLPERTVFARLNLVF